MVAFDLYCPQKIIVHKSLMHGMQNIKSQRTIRVTVRTQKVTAGLKRSLQA